MNKKFENEENLGGVTEKEQNAPEVNKADKEPVRDAAPMSRRTLKYVLLIIAFGIALYWIATHTDFAINLIKQLYSIISPIIVGLCIAFIINMVLNPIEALWNLIFKKLNAKLDEKPKGKEIKSALLVLRRAVCLILATALVFGAVFAVVFMMIPQFEESINDFIDKLPGYFLNLEFMWRDLSEFAANWDIELPEFAWDYKVIGTYLRELLEKYGGSVIDTTVGITATIFSGIVNFVLSLALSIYLLAQKERIGRKMTQSINALLPDRKADRLLHVVKVTNLTFTRFVAGQLIEAVIIGLLCLIGMLIFGFPYAPVVSMIVGVTALIPMFGAFFGAALGAVLILFVSPIKAFWFIVFIIILQQLEGNLIYPRVVGKSVRLPGIIVLASITVGGGIFGIPGMLFCVPVCSVLYFFYNEYLAKKENAKLEAAKDADEKEEN